MTTAFGATSIMSFATPAAIGPWRNVFIKPAGTSSPFERVNAETGADFAVGHRGARVIHARGEEHVVGAAKRLPAFSVQVEIDVDPGLALHVVQHLRNRTARLGIPVPDPQFNGPHPFVGEDPAVNVEGVPAAAPISVTFIGSVTATSRSETKPFILTRPRW